MGKINLMTDFERGYEEGWRDCQIANNIELAHLRGLLGEVRENALVKESIPESSDVYWVCLLCGKEIGLGDKGTDTEEHYKDCIMPKLTAALETEPVFQRILLHELLGRPGGNRDTDA